MANTINSRVGERVRRLRTARGLTQAELAEKALLATQTLSRVERGDQGASLESLERIAVALGEPIAALFEFKGEGKAVPGPAKAMAEAMPADPKELRRRLERAFGVLAGDE
ncbi:MAG: helix-turn-helix transcriptional regulator [Pseudomonadota bacterium]|nr:helix-turn-helix transcriptional regulator [Pseudomonadota bacterium]